MALFFAILLIVILFAGWMLTLLGIPGNWLMVVAAAAYVYLIPADWPASIGWKVIVMLFVLATMGEIIEFAAGAAGTAKAGGSKRSALLALVGSIIGSFVGIFLGLPIPLIGPLVGAVLFAALGALVGAGLGELWVGGNLDTSWKIGTAAFWGRVAGTLGKLLVGAVMIALVVAALIF